MRNKIDILSNQFYNEENINIVWEFAMSYKLIFELNTFEERILWNFKKYYGVSPL